MCDYGKKNRQKTGVIGKGKHECISRGNQREQANTDNLLSFGTARVINHNDFYFYSREMDWCIEREKKTRKRLHTATPFKATSSVLSNKRILLDTLIFFFFLKDRAWQFTPLRLPKDYLLTSMKSHQNVLGSFLFINIIGQYCSMCRCPEDRLYNSTEKVPTPYIIKKIINQQLIFLNENWKTLLQCVCQSCVTGKIRYKAHKDTGRLSTGKHKWWEIGNIFHIAIHNIHIA